MNWNTNGVTRDVAARTIWAAIGAPLAFVVTSVSLLMWPLVLNNSRRNLMVLAYVVLVPFMPLLWRGRKPLPIMVAAILTVGLQFVLYGVIGHWFDGTWAT